MSEQQVLQQYVGSMSVLIYILCVKSLIRLFILVSLRLEDKNTRCLVQNVTIKIKIFCYSLKEKRGSLYEVISSRWQKYVIYGLKQLSHYSDSLRAGRSGIRIPVGSRFSASVQTGPGAYSDSYKMGTVLSREKSGRDVALNTHLHLESRLRKDLKDREGITKCQIISK